MKQITLIKIEKINLDDKTKQIILIKVEKNLILINLEDESLKKN